MKIQTNIRAGSGGASGGGKNGNPAAGADNTATTTPDTSGPINNTVVSFYVPPVNRCPGF